MTGVRNPSLLRLDPVDRRPAGLGAALAGKEEVVFGALEEQGRKAIEEDGADGLDRSTTMPKAVEHRRATLGVPVVNPGLLAIKLAELMVHSASCFSKVAYSRPRRSRTRSSSPWRRRG